MSSVITINATNYNVLNLTVEEELGQFDKFSCVLPNPTATQRTALGDGGHKYPTHHVSISDKDGTVVFQGFLENVADAEKTTDITLEGRDYRSLLVDERTGMDVEWINQTGATIINALLAYSTKVVAGTITFTETVSGTMHFSHESLLNAIASVCNNAGKDFWITRSGSTFSLNVGTRGSGSSGSPAHTWTVGEDLVSANEQKLARDIINRQRVFGAGDGINQIAVCVPYIDINLADDARHQGFDGTNASCVHAAATTSQTAVGVMEGEPYTDSSIVSTSVAIATAKAILDASVGSGAKKLYAVPKYYLSGVTLGSWARVIDPYKAIDTTARIKIIKRKLYNGSMSFEFLSGNEGLESILSSIKRTSNLSNVNGLGATNLITQNYPDICDNTHPYEFIFQLPEEVVYINRVKLSYIVGSYRTYSATLAAAGVHSHSLGFWNYDSSKDFYIMGTQDLGGAVGDAFTIMSGAPVESTSEASDTHNHTTTYAISDAAASLTDIAISIDDGSGYVDRTAAIEAVYGTLSTSQELDLLLTSYFTANGGIKKIKITPTGSNNGICRIVGLLAVQFYMESR